MPTSIASKRATFRALHASGCFVLPNPWDIGSAKVLEGLGFKALASTSAGFAWSQGLPDNRVTRAMVLEHLRALVAATEVPINADFEGGFGSTPAEVAESVRMAVDTGVAGLSIEDSTGDAKQPLRALDDAVTRVRAARIAIDATGGATLLVARAENFFVGVPDLDDTITRLKAYAQAGADCLYAPGLATAEHIAAVVNALAPKPVNVLVGGVSPFTVDALAALGVRRVSLGAALPKAAWGGFLRAARALAADGHFNGFADAANGAEMNGLFKQVD